MGVLSKCKETVQAKQCKSTDKQIWKLSFPTVILKNKIKARFLLFGFPTRGTLVHRDISLQWQLLVVVVILSKRKNQISLCKHFAELSSIGNIILNNCQLVIRKPIMIPSAVGAKGDFVGPKILKNKEDLRLIKDAIAKTRSPRKIRDQNGRCCVRLPQGQ